MLAHTSLLAHGAFVVACCVALGLYGAAWLASPRRSTVRLWSWTLGMVALAVSTAPTVERWAAASFTGHMVQHLLMIVVAAPLLVLARPVATFAAHWSPGWLRSAVHRRTSAWWRRSGPLVAPTVFLAVLYITHLTGIYDAALHSQPVHDLEHLAYVGAACALWAVVTAGGRASAAARVGAVFGVIGGSALLGVVLLTASTPLVPTYAIELGTDAAVDDQRAAASLMWVGGMAITLPLLIVAVWRWAAAEQRIAERSEAARDEAARRAVVGIVTPPGNS
jgi:putative membrane protein